MLEVCLNNINENFQKGVYNLLQEMFTGSLSNVKVKGTKEQITKFASVLMAEKDYIEAIKEQGEGSIMAAKTKAKLQGKINDFERLLGIEWPVQ